MRVVKYGVVACVSLALHFSFYHSDIIKNIDYAIYDAISILVEKIEPTEGVSYTVIVDIDTKSIHQSGEWPWSRAKQAELIDKIDAMNPSAIGVNIFFPEADQENPFTLTKSIQQSRSVLSVYFQESFYTAPHCQELSYRNNIFVDMVTKYYAPAILCNHQLIQEYIMDYGFINAKVDSDGFFRRMPLFMGHNHNIFPSFALAILLSLDRDITIEGSNQFTILNHQVKMGLDSSVLLDFSTAKPRTISAIDLLDGRISPTELQGKIVILGSTVIGLSPTYLVSTHKKFSNIRLHTTLIDNILNDALHIQPEHDKKLNILFSLFLSMVVLFLLIKRWYVSMIILLFGTTVLSLIWLVSCYFNGTYISIGYFWAPFGSYFFMISLLFIVINIQEKQKFYEELRQSHSSTVESLSLVVAMRDDETGEHLRRTKNYIKILAEHLYQKGLYSKILNVDYIVYLYEAAPLHDIGKMGISDEILKKPGRYTPQEYEIMKEHPLLAKNVIEKVMKHYDKNIFLNVVYNIAYYHHERWDGKGYPVGLKEDAIPLEAQLMAIADVYDALISKRCYKEEYAYEKAESIIIEGRGGAFNPIIVDAFIELKENFREIAERYKDNTL